MSAPRTVRLSPNDNVVVAVDPIAEGAQAALHKGRRAFRRLHGRAVLDADSLDAAARHDSRAVGRDASARNRAAADRPADGAAQPAREPADASGNAAARAADAARHTDAGPDDSARDDRAQPRSAFGDAGRGLARRDEPHAVRHGRDA